MRTTLLLLLMAFCSCTMRKPHEIPDTATAEKLIIESYTADNQLDGAEICTVEDLKILETNWKQDHCEVKYHIKCSYSGPAMPEGYERQRPPIDTDSLVNMKKENGAWFLK